METAWGKNYLNICMSLFTAPYLSSFSFQIPHVLGIGFSIPCSKSEESAMMWWGEVMKPPSHYLLMIGEKETHSGYLSFNKTTFDLA